MCLLIYLDSFTETAGWVPQGSPACPPAIRQPAPHSGAHSSVAVALAGGTPTPPRCWPGTLLAWLESAGHQPKGLGRPSTALGLSLALSVFSDSSILELGPQDSQTFNPLQPRGTGQSKLRWGQNLLREGKVGSSQTSAWSQPGLSTGQERTGSGGRI